MPLAAHGGVGGQDLHGVAGDPPLTATGGQLLGADFLTESADRGVGVAFDEVPGHVEKHHHRVEVLVRLRAEGSAAQGSFLQAGIQPGGLPDLPEHHLHGLSCPLCLPARGEDVAHVLQDLQLAVIEARGPLGGILRAGGAVEQGAERVTGLERQSRGVLRHRLALQTLAGQRLGQHALEAAHHDRVGSTDHGFHEYPHLGVLQRPVGGLQGSEQQPDQGLFREDDGGLVDPHRHPVGQQSSPDGCNLPDRAHDDSHVLPGHTVADVGAAQSVGDVQPLGSPGVRPEYSDRLVPFFRGTGRGRSVAGARRGMLPCR